MYGRVRLGGSRGVRLELNSVAKDVDADFVKELTVDVWLGAGDETLTADGEYLAHGIATTDDAFTVGISSPDRIVLDHFNDDRIFGDAAKKCSEVAV